MKRWPTEPVAPRIATGTRWERAARRASSTERVTVIDELSCKSDSSARARMVSVGHSVINPLGDVVSLLRRHVRPVEGHLGKAGHAGGEREVKVGLISRRV